jgi:hypothetical protein
MSTETTLPPKPEPVIPPEAKPAETALPTAERQHHPFSPSTLQAREACPSYNGKEGDANEAALRGSLQHSLTETEADIDDLSDEESDAAVECLEFFGQRQRLMELARDEAVRKLAAELQGGLRPWAESLALAEKEIPQVLVLTEVQLKVDAERVTYGKAEVEKGRPTGRILVRETDCTTSGYVDRVLIDHTRTYAELFDWKFGKWPVESAENNVQGMAYMVGLRRDYPTLGTVRVYFKQPHIGVLTHHDFPVTAAPENLLRIRAIVARAAEDSLAGDFKRATPSVGACLFCGRLGLCHKAAEIFLNISKKFMPMQIPATVTPSLLRAPGEAALALKVAQVAKAWGEAIRSATADAVVSGRMEMPDGFKLETKADRCIADPVKFKALVSAYLKPEEWASLLPQTPTITAVEKKISANAPRGQKTATLGEFNERAFKDGALDREAPIVFLKQSSAKKEES